MNVNTVTLPTAATWDAFADPAYFISKAQFALLREGRVELVMDPQENRPDMLPTMHICYAGHEGLHYDGDSYHSPAQLLALIITQGADISHDWAICEAYLRSYAQNLNLPNH